MPFGAANVAKCFADTRAMQSEQAVPLVPFLQTPVATQWGQGACSDTERGGVDALDDVPGAIVGPGAAADG